MMSSTNEKNIYDECKHIHRTKPEYVIDEETLKGIGSDYRTLPTFEKGLFERVYKDHYSLQRNELLKCRWGAYKKRIEGRVFSPFQFPDVRDLHFHKNAIRFVPIESVHRFPDYRMKLKPGPGVDRSGQMPIPQELLMKRGQIEMKKIV